MTQTSSRQTGFTLVELIVVIILLGILSVYAAPRLFGTSGFSVYAAQEQAITIIRQIQLGSMQYNDSSSVPTYYQLRVSNNCLGSVYTCELTDSEKESLSDSLVLGNNSPLTFSPTLTVTFDLFGNPSSGDTTINIAGGDETLSVCINSQGYVFRGGCQ
jgi:MSHA pilin protein MshC